MGNNNPIDFLYDEDTSGSSVFNKVENELHIVTTGEPADFNVIVPKMMPYYRDTMVIRHVPTDRVLLRGIDWMPGHFFSSATFETESIKGGIYGSILIMDRNLRGEFQLVEYQTLGGEWTLGNDKVLEILARRATDPRSVTYEQVSGKPNIFPPTGHNHPIEDYTGFSEAVVGILDVAQAIRERTQTWLDNPPILMSQYYIKEETRSKAREISHEVFDERIGDTIDLINDSVNHLAGELENAINNRYSKAASDARYYQKSEVYTKSESDNNLSQALSSYYTKVESDSRYYLKTETYTRAEMDGRYSYRTTKVNAGVGLSGGGTLAADRTLNVVYGQTAGTAVEGNETRIVNAVQNTRQVLAGTGLSGGGTLAADRTLTVKYGTEAGTATQGNDTRVVNAVQTSRRVIAGTGLSGGGTLAGDRTLSVSVTGIPNTSQSLGGGLDLNNYQTPGFYHQTANASAANGRNYPEAMAGSLVVYNAAGVTQQYHVYNSSRVWTRGFYNGSWSAWQRPLYNDEIRIQSNQLQALVNGAWRVVWPPLWQ